MTWSPVGVVLRLILARFQPRPALLFSTQTLSNERFLSRLHRYTSVQERVNTRFLGVCGDNRLSN
jgi:hypothetical protein